MSYKTIRQEAAITPVKAVKGIRLNNNDPLGYTSELYLLLPSSQKRHQINECTSVSSEYVIKQLTLVRFPIQAVLLMRFYLQSTQMNLSPS